MMSVIAVLRRTDASRRDKFLAFVNLFGFVYFILMTSILTYLSLFVIVPLRFGHSSAATLKHFGAILFLFLNVVGNFVNVLRVDSTVNRLKSYSKVKDKDFRLECSKCQRGVPRRTHHCPLCNICVLKRDHHCFFLCTCIGYFNQKYFFMFCLYMTVAGLYGTILLAVYMHLQYEVRFTSLLAFITLLPSTLQGWWFDTVNPPTFAQLSVVGIFYSTLSACLMASGLFLWQIFITSQGQTTHEAKHGVNKYSRSLKENFLDVFGPYWFITLVLPVPLPQRGDGTYLHKASGVSSKKAPTKTGIHTKKER